jgi:hypothetical protein
MTDALIGIAAAALLGVIGLVTFSHFGHSHVSQTLHAARKEGASAIIPIILRKSAMNIKLTFHSYWAFLMISNLLGSYLAFRKQQPQSDTGTIVYKCSVFSAGAATLASALFNDAGVIGGGLCALYLWAAIALQNTQTDRELANT